MVLANKLYYLDSDFMDSLKLPSVDPLFFTVVSKALLPREGDSQLKDPNEHCLDYVIHRAQEANALAI